ncbi:twin-arginine translocase TatA/TatE family subunit [Nocardia sp. NPDC059239]|uniref:twin-arginine translocase TatA/TatE family subunit n=1 Tax=Nocardia sp. NPDC059239 TaxID=3346785 RepID=UPI0036B788E0
MTGTLSPWHALVVVMIFLLLFGSKHMPAAARSLDTSMRIFTPPQPSPDPLPSPSQTSAQ